MLGLGPQGQGSAGQQAKGVLRRRQRGGGLTGAQGHTALQQRHQFEAGQGLPQLAGRRDEHRFELVDRLRLGFDGRVAGQLQDSDDLDLVVAVFRGSGCGAGQHGSCGGFGVDGIGLALAVPGGSVGPVDLDDASAGVAQVAGEPSAVGAGAFHPERVDLSQITGPVVQPAVAGGGGRHDELGEPAAERVERDGDVQVLVRVDPDNDADRDIGAGGGGHAGDGLLLAGSGCGSPPVGRADTTARRPRRATLL